jgi:exopolyphosphatase/guanosine-5'-triphosphate,3'-diphosphate pyrophosphatase
MVFAVIDLGTNTFNLLIGETLPDNTFKKIFNTKIAVKLGEGTINSGYIADAPFQRGINALKQYQQYILDYNVEQEFAFATSAVRSASNGSEFVKQAWEKAKISVMVIDGDEEAELVYYGNRMAVAMTDNISLIMDIGGGSTEFILADQSTIFWKKSFQLGAARLLDKFKPCDPITEEEIGEFKAYLKQELQPLREAVKQYQPVELIGSSGAFDSVVDLIGGEFNRTLINDVETEYHISLGEYDLISKKIIGSTLQERYQMPYLINMRADMMVISIMLIDYVLKEINLNVFKTSTFSLKEGVISKKLGLTLR